MRHKSETVKQSIIQKALARENKSLSEIAIENNVGSSTLHRWLKEANAKESTSTVNLKKEPHSLTQAQKIQVLLETANLDDLSIGAYCRERGFYRHHIEEWKRAIMTAQEQPQKKQQQAQLLKKLQAENKQLKKDLRRKEKALAETSALLILKKKADLIWGDIEED